ncbi:MAG: hypothetical protein KC776_03930 [Myxococcales bacterium]|nr:hypothetical protein [Myxococcales bacterium]MCB9580145.1 rhodanese-like domain-containing protein [Polyangiaceae bacterium]
MNLTRRHILAALPIAILVACQEDPPIGSTSKPAKKRAELGPMMKPADLVKRLDDVKAGKIAVLYVGPEILFDHGHVPGAKKLLEAGTDAGKKLLVKEIANTPKDVELVVYCGCCPYASCPNVRPANEALHASGRKNFYLLDLPTNFKTDWKDKGYPSERS